LNVVREDLRDGSVSGEADVLFLAAPKDLDEKQLFAVDQFLMQGGTVIAATSPYAASLSQRSLSLQKQESGLSAWLKHHGLSIDEKLVMDKQSVPFPLPVNRNIGGFSVQEMRMLDYPYFIDVRADGLNAESAITNSLPQTTMAWASPIVLDTDKQKSRKVTELLRSSDRSWVSGDMNIAPQITSEGITRYLPSGEQKSQLLGVITQGRFDSFFAGKKSPLLKKENADSTNEQNTQPDATKNIGSVIQHSPDSARIILFSSNDFLSDPVVSMAGMANGGQYLNSLQLMANTFDWALEDEGLMSIRARSNFNRTLPTMEQSTQAFWEYLNYGLALLALAVVGFVQYRVKRAREQQYRQWLAS
jgi:ABC-2 type transport system permease protein